jgi:predicted dehydrogenase
VAAICDVDESHLGRAVKIVTDQGGKPGAHTDIRKVLDDKNIDALIVVTPNHWHALATVWGCQAGKDVYVEKPVSHDIWEGRQMIAAAKKYNRIVQAGIQARSDKAMQEAFDWLQAGNLGKILVARGFCYKERLSIGKVTAPTPIPQGVNYNLWLGPAEKTPLMRKELHYDWHWQWNTGNGDIANQGAHQMDQCRRALGQKALPKRVMSFGGRFGYVDDGETPNTHIAIFDYEPAPLIFEVRGLHRTADDKAMDSYKGAQIGIVIECEGGYYQGGWAHDKDGKKVKQFAEDGGGNHYKNFIDAVRSRKVEDLNAFIPEGHVTSALCHAANISYRIGKEALPEEIREAVKTQNQITDRVERFEEHLAANGVDLKKNKATLGPWLEIDTEKERFVGEGDIVAKANSMLKRQMREPFVIPDQV